MEGVMMENKYSYNEEMYQWERVDKVQHYKGYKIETISTHDDSWQSKHREYRVTAPNNHVSYFGINKRGGNITSLKYWIDTKEA